MSYRKMPPGLGNPEFEIARNAFNLAGETAEDPQRLAREAEERRQRLREAAEYQKRMQLTFESCRGFIGADMPAGPGQRGRVTVEPGKVREAVEWLRRRYNVAENMELSGDCGLCLEFQTRRKGVTVPRIARKVSFGKPEQYELSL